MDTILSKSANAFEKFWKKNPIFLEEITHLSLQMSWLNNLTFVFKQNTGNFSSFLNRSRWMVCLLKKSNLMFILMC